jgi:hypothetical protein
MTLAGVAAAELFEDVSGIRCACSEAFTATGDVLLGAGNGAFVSNGLDDTFTSATCDS